MKKIIGLWMSMLALLLMTVGLSACDNNSSKDEPSGPMTPSEATHSECRERAATRSGDDENPFATKLKLTYNEGDATITGEYVNYTLSCDYTDAGLNIGQDTDGTLVLNPWNKADNMVNCFCNINFYFTIRDVNSKNFHLVVNRRTVTVVEADGSKHEETWADYDGYISFERQSVVVIDFNEVSQSLYAVARQSADAFEQYEPEMWLFTINDIKSFCPETGEIVFNNLVFDAHLFHDFACKYRVYFYSGDDLLFDARAVSWLSSAGYFSDLTFQCDAYGPGNTLDCSKSHFYLRYGYPGTIVGDTTVEALKQKNAAGMERFVSILGKAGKIVSKPEWSASSVFSVRQG